MTSGEHTAEWGWIFAWTATFQQFDKEEAQSVPYKAAPRTAIKLRKPYYKAYASAWAMEGLFYKAGHRCVLK